MIKCSKCNKELKDDAKVCDSCGTPVVKDLSDADTKKAPKKKSLLVPILIAVIALVVVVGAGVFFVMTAGKSDKKVPARALYVKDKELFVSDLSNKKPVQLSSKLASGESDEVVVSYAAYNMYSSIHLSRDGKIVFYPDKFDGETYTLYRKDITKPDKEGVKIDTGISIDYFYYVSEDSNIVTYVKGSTLYQYDVRKKEKEKIDSNINGWSDMHADDSGKKILYLKENGDFYLKEVGKDKEKIDSDVSSIEEFNYKDGKFIGVSYIKDDNLYIKNEGKEKEKIASNVEEVVAGYNDGSFYYTKKGKNGTGVLMDYVEDDMKEQDASVEEPVEPEYPSWFGYNSTEEYQAAVDAYNTANEEYIKAKEEYDEKVRRDNLREELSQEELNVTAKELYFYNGKEEKKISDSFYNEEQRFYKTPMIVFSEAKKKNNKKVKLSEIEYVYDVYDELGYDLGLLNDRDMVVAIGDKISPIEEDDIGRIEVAEKAKVIYFIADIDREEDTGDLYEVKIEGDGLSEAQIYDEDIYSLYLTLSVDENRLSYFKDYEEEEGTLIVNKKEVDKDVYADDIGNSYVNKDIYYYKNYNSNKERGDLMVYNGSKSKTVAEDVHDFEMFEDGTVLYLSDYTNRKYKGSLMSYKNGKSRLIDEDVMAIFKYVDLSR